MKNILIAVWISVVIVLSGCDTGQGPRNDIHRDIRGKVSLRIAEEFTRYDSASTPVLMLTMRTYDIYECFNFRIDYRLIRTNNEFDVTIFGVTAPSICLDALGPATSRDSFDVSPGEYHLAVHLHNMTDIYTVTVSESAVQLTAHDSSVSRPEASLFWRYPRQSFAVYCGTLTSTSWMCTAFYDTLIHHLPLQEIEPPNVGVWPYSLESSGHYYDAPTRFYRYATEADFDSAGALLKRFAKTVIDTNAGVSVWMQNWRNKEYFSWMLNSPYSQ
ncbi:MAG: hypothetical protein HY033_13565 [Ignavibacteriae bacterium]|nr:hypothetical protein [Ignavibacteria bacterium]MBI3365920.1 hypothetical protein [Ignavibacteriota bacterium]